MTYKDFELASLNMQGVEAIKLVLTGDVQKKLKRSARKKKWFHATLLPNDTYLIDLGEYTIALSCHKTPGFMS